MSMPTGETYDVVVVGAGPAGTVAARELGKDFRVLLVDRGHLPQNKPCGGLLNEESIDILGDWDGVAAIRTSPPFVKLGYIDFDSSTSIRTDRQFWNVDRKDLSSWLLGRLPETVTVSPRTALRDVAVTDEGIEVVLAGQTDGRLTTTYLVGADGGNSTVRRALSSASTPRRNLYQVLVDGSSEDTRTFTWFLFDSSVTDCYSWVIPKRGGTLVGTALTGNDKESMDLLIGKVSEQFGISTTIVERGGHPAALIASLEDIELGQGNVLLAGEAAGLISPSSFEGISYALESALLAAQALRGDRARVADTYGELCRPLLLRLSEQLRKSKVVFDRSRRGAYWSSIAPA